MNDSLSELFTVAMTETEKRVLSDMAHSDGTAMRQVVRRLVRGEAQRRGLWPTSQGVNDGR